MADYVKENIQTNDIIVVCPPFYDVNFLYHYKRSLFVDYGQDSSAIEQGNIQPIYSYNDIDFRNGAQRLFYVNAKASFLYPGNNILNELDNKHINLSNEAFKGGYSIHLYEIKKND